MACMNSAISLTVRAIGPFVAIGIHRLELGTVGTRPPEGRKPTTLQNDAGLRNDPPKSDPSASGSIRHDRAHERLAQVTPMLLSLKPWKLRRR